MTISDTFALLAGVPLVVVVPQLVNLAKQQGLPTRYAGVAAIACSIVLLALAGFALNPEITVADGARWMIGGVVYGLAAAGLHSQRQMFSRPSPPSPDETASP